MTNLANITTQELRKDLEETERDIGWCQLAIEQGIFSYGAGDERRTVERLRINHLVKTTIETELQRRVEPQGPTAYPSHSSPPAPAPTPSPMISTWTACATSWPTAHPTRPAR